MSLSFKNLPRDTIIIIMQFYLNASEIEHLRSRLWFLALMKGVTHNYTRHVMFRYRYSKWIDTDHNDGYLREINQVHLHSIFVSESRIVYDYYYIDCQHSRMMYADGMTSNNLAKMITHEALMKLTHRDTNLIEQVKGTQQFQWATHDHYTAVKNLYDADTSDDWYTPYDIKDVFERDHMYYYECARDSLRRGPTGNATPVATNLKILYFLASMSDTEKSCALVMHQHTYGDLPRDALTVIMLYHLTPSAIVALQKHLWFLALMKGTTLSYERCITFQCSHLEWGDDGYNLSRRLGMGLGRVSLYVCSYLTHVCQGRVSMERFLVDITKGMLMTDNKLVLGAPPVTESHRAHWQRQTRVDRMSEQNINSIVHKFGKIDHSVYLYEREYFDHIHSLFFTCEYAHHADRAIESYMHSSAQYVHNAAIEYLETGVKLSKNIGLLITQ